MSCVQRRTLAMPFCTCCQIKSHADDNGDYDNDDDKNEDDDDENDNDDDRRL